MFAFLLSQLSYFSDAGHFAECRYAKCRLLNVVAPYCIRSLNQEFLRPSLFLILQQIFEGNMSFRQQTFRQQTFRLVILATDILSTGIASKTRHFVYSHFLETFRLQSFCQHAFHILSFWVWAFFLYRHQIFDISPHQI